MFVVALLGANPGTLFLFRTPVRRGKEEGEMGGALLQAEYGTALTMAEFKKRDEA